ncbi:hypothetical protein [Lysinibacillus sp. NPDC056232]|uniref:hypothetical protein n=1 Tax=Lysinibacillus sp. NPDC056232 TaxID=3345756 RepID=UPI0035D8F60A
MNKRWIRFLFFLYNDIIQSYFKGGYYDARFSAAVSEIAEVEYVRTALTFQICIGFLVTIISINLIPIIQRIIGWEWVFTILAIGPILGILSMLKYRGTK